MSEEFRRPVASHQGNPEPLVSCMMLTIPGREQFAEQAKRCFRDQTYQNTELVIVTGPGTIGAKRNVGCQRARGEYIAHWDDDDWSDPRRLQIQCAALRLRPVVGFCAMWFYDTRDGSAWRYDARRTQGTSNYAVGTSLCYRRDYWRRHPFADRQLGEDNEFQQAARIHGEIGVYDCAHLMVARRHGANTCQWERAQQMMGLEWRRAELSELPDQFLVDNGIVLAA